MMHRLPLLVVLLLVVPATAVAAPDQPDEPHALPLAPVAGRPRAPVRPAPAPSPPVAPVASTSSVSGPPTKARSSRLFRFDALRIEGLAGPNALVLRTLDHGRRRSLLRYRRSFLRRILATLEAPTR